MRIEYLADHPELVETLARWHYDEWRDLIPEWSYERTRSELASHDARAAIPTTLLALDEAAPIGSASLVTEDLPEHRFLTPWVASVFVAPAWRGRGVGSALVRRAVDVAGDLGVSKVYLATPGQAAFYRKLGWREEPIPAAPGRPVMVMSIVPRR